MTSHGDRDRIAVVLAGNGFIARRPESDAPQDGGAATVLLHPGTAVDGGEDGPAIAHHHPDPAVREEAQDWVDLNTPLVKAFCTDAAFELGSTAIQVYGGHGFVRDHGVEQIVRDSKILCLYEGTNGIQAMDLVRRKLLMHDGRLAQRFFARVRAENQSDAPVGYLVRPLMKALEALVDDEDLRLPEAYLLLLEAIDSGKRDDVHGVLSAAGKVLTGPGVDA